MKRQRFLLISLGLAALALFILFSYARIMVLEPDPTLEGGLALPEVERGNIFDRNGRLLAGTVTLHSVSAWMPHVQDRDKTAHALAGVLNLDADSLRERLERANGFLFVKRKIPPSEAKAVRELLRSESLPGIRLEEEYGRIYPLGELGADWVGFVGTDNVGLAGIEFSYNSVLLPGELGPGKRRGGDVYLTLDSSLQFIVEEILEKTLQEHRAERAFALVAHAPSGEILAMAERPAFHPERFAEYPAEIRRNHLAESVYEPGSVFKMFTIAILLEAGVITPQSTFVCNGVWEKTLMSGETVRIRCLAPHGVVDPMGILQVSCNVGIAQSSELLDAPTFESGLRAFGFGSPVQAPFPGEAAGLLAPHGRWSARTKPTIAFGQEIAVSALQIVQAALAIANQGLMLRPLFVKRALSGSGEVLLEATPQEVRRVLTARTSKQLLEMLRASIAMGGGSRARIQGIDVGGKTGTAQLIDPKTGQYSDTEVLPSILLFLPALNPEFIVYLGVYKPRGPSLFGDRVAAPPARQIAERLIGLYGVVREGDRVIEHDGQVRVVKPSAPLVGDTLPDYRGYAKRTLLSLLEHPRLRVVFSGEGHVVRQRPPPGTPVRDGMDLILEFE